MDSGTTETSEQIALYFSFSQGEHRGISTQSGFFANFELDEVETYALDANGDGEEWRLLKREVSADFKGFSLTLQAYRDGHGDMVEDEELKVSAQEAQKQLQESLKLSDKKLNLLYGQLKAKYLTDIENGREDAQQQLQLVTDAQKKWLKYYESEMALLRSGHMNSCEQDVKQLEMLNLRVQKLEQLLD